MQVDSQIHAERSIENSLKSLGYTLFDFSDLSAFREVVALVSRDAGQPLETIRDSSLSFDEHTRFIKSLTDSLESSRCVNRLLEREKAFISKLLGPDVDIQTRPHLRISRPKMESEAIGFHRDIFYGNSPFEMNIWFPLLPLNDGAGLELVAGSHVEPSRNERVIAETDEFKKTVTKGSVANSIGFVYAPKVDDSIANLDPQRIHLIRPRVGQAVLFFGCMIHRGRNQSDTVRISIDTRVKHASTNTSTKTGYYMPLFRGPISECVQRFVDKGNF